MRSKPEKTRLPTVAPDVDRLIIEVRGEKVILDTDLAALYGVTTKALNQAVKRNPDRFPDGFAFFLTSVEKSEVVTNCDHLGRLKFSHVVPRAFTEHGAMMAANVLNSPRAVQMSVFVVRAFIKMRRILTESVGLARKLAALEQELKGRLDVHEAAIVEFLQRIMRILDPPPAPPEPPQPQIGFHVKEDTTPYRIRRKTSRPS